MFCIQITGGMSLWRTHSFGLYVVLLLVGIVSFGVNRAGNIAERVDHGFTGEKPSSSSSLHHDPKPKRISPACTFNHHRGIGKEGSRIDKIVLVHMRKAGGTSMKAYLREVAKKYNISFEDYEGERPLLPDDADNSTFLVTHLREPTARVISNYKYEIRWSCQSLTSKSGDFVPTLNNTKTSLEGFVEQRSRPMPAGGEKGNLWICSHNCYSKWSTGLCWDEGNTSESAMCASQNDTQGPLISRAREELYKYNLIVIIEWLKNPEYVRAIEAIFGVEGISQQRTDMWCGRQSAEANKKFPLVVSEEMIQRIKEVNQLDTALYNELTDCSGFNFPNHSIFQ